MNTGWLILIIVLVLGVVLGNVMLLRYSTKFKMPKRSSSAKPSEEAQNPTDQTKNP